MDASSPLLSLWRRPFEEELSVTLSVPSVGPDHIAQRCAMHLQNPKKRATSASTVSARATHQEGVQAD